MKIRTEYVAGVRWWSAAGVGCLVVFEKMWMGGF